MFFEGKISICFFADGENLHTRRWLREMVARNFEVTLVTRRPQEMPGVRVITVSDSLGRLGWFQRILEIRRIVREVRPDIVHGHYVTSYGFWAAVSGIHPLVLTAWGSDILVTPKKSRLMRLLVGWTISRADLITADSLDMIEEILKYPVRGEAKQVQWGVDLDAFRPMPSRRNDGFGVLSLRTWSENYNVDIIIRAFAEFHNLRPELRATLHLLGGGELEGDLRALVKKLEVDSLVKFHGKVSEDCLPEIMSLCDVSISVPTSDATAMSLLESMAMGLPVVVSDLAANRQWVDNKSGFVVPRRDVDAIVTALLALADDPNLRKEMGERNRFKIEKEASRKAEMDRMATVYRRLLVEKGC